MDITPLFVRLAGPARRALRTLDLNELEDLAKYSRKMISDLHGIGPAALKVMESEMASHDITFLDADEGKKETGIPPIDRYIQGFPRRTQALLKEMRRIIRSVAPDAAEKISYQMPTFHLHGNLVHFAGYERHIGFYPTSSGISAFESELGPYKHAKGSVQFPIEEPLPADLIMRITRFRLEENMRNASTAKWKKKSGT